MIAFHRWLIKQRIWCELCPMDLIPATQVVRNLNEKDVVLCHDHAEWLKQQKRMQQLFSAVSQTEEWDYKPRSKRTCAS